MKLRAMWTGAPGSTDLVHHTVKHFLSSQEREEWDRVPAGAATAESLGMSIPRHHPARPSRADDPVDPCWWSSPWQAHAQRVHAAGYRPRYEFLADMLGPAPGARWERQGRRWLGDLYGFRLVVEPRGLDGQVISAFFSRTFRYDDRPDTSLRAFRAHAARVNCPPAPAPGVPSPEKKS